MAINDYQRHSFLGGEVSPTLYERCDMDKFGRWFANAENIRFYETGGFRNRPGFVKIADTKYGIAGQIIKLISFSFNDEESFLVEFGPGYARFFRNGEPIMVNGEPYELATPFVSFDEDDIKYAQAGDTIFLTHPDYGIYELVRQNVLGTEWTFNKFRADLLPMGEINDDKEKTVSATSVEINAKKCSIENPYSSIYSNVSFTFNSSVVYTAESVSQNQLLEGIQEAIGSDYVVIKSGDDMEILPADPTGTVPSFSISFQAIGLLYYTVAVDNGVTEHESGSIVYFSVSDIFLDQFDSLEEVYVKARHANGSIPFEGTLNIHASSVNASANLAKKFGAFTAKNGSTQTHYSPGCQVLTQSSTNRKYLRYYVRLNRNGAGSLHTWLTLTGKKNQTISYSYSSSTVTEDSYYYQLLATYPIFSDVAIGENFLIQNSIDAEEINGTYTENTTLGPILSDGNWRTYSLGNWAGKVQIQYSTDNKQTWVDYFSWASEDANSFPYNVSTSGTLKSDSTVYFRVVLTITSGSIKFFFSGTSFEVNSYYEIISKASDTTVVVRNLKNDIGADITSNYKWRKQVFSKANGFPQTIGFYQNRLFLAKDYIVYGSRTNDFWDFYEPISLQADDPITMSLLSTKANIIRNLVTQRSFFVFTSGGEYGIGSEGALTQSDKYLKAFSSNGSNPCLPVLISDVVLFVDKSGNSVRALKYSLESDGFEAPDITLMLREKLSEERIITTETIFEDKEALFLSETGTIWVLKYITDQNVLSWSHWKHARGKITNICVVPNGDKHDLYIVVERGEKQWIEKIEKGSYLDTIERFEATDDAKVEVSGLPGDIKTVLQGGRVLKMTVDANNQIDCPPDTTASFQVGDTYVSTATLLSPTIQLTQESSSNYEKKTIFKVFFYYLNSYGFKVGVSDGEKMKIEWQPVESTIDEENELTSGKKSVLIPSSFDGSERLTFVQEEPYPMEIHDVLSKTDFGGK